MLQKPLTSLKAQQFTESVIREMTRLALQYDAINLSQGFPDFPAPQEIKEAAIQAINRDINQYAITWGAPSLRMAITEKLTRVAGHASPDCARRAWKVPANMRKQNSSLTRDIEAIRMEYYPPSKSMTRR